MHEQLTGPQRAAIAELTTELGATGVIVDRDEPHDTHVFVSFHIPDAPRHEERIIDADGTYEHD